MENKRLIGFNAVIDSALQAKWDRLVSIFQQMPSAMVAFSGGVDSGLLCAAAYVALGARALAVTVISPVEADDDGEAARQVTQVIGIAHQIVPFNDLDNPTFVENPPDRCYHCKLNRFRAMQTLARELGFDTLIEGSNADDQGDYRPGMRAVMELNVRSPLVEVGLAKAEIRRLAHALGLPNWDRPSAPCLATRFPYGTPVTLEGLRQVAAGEAFLRQAGYQPVRVRHHGSMARLEVSPDQIQRLAEDRQRIVEFFKSIGFTYIAVDLAGYRLGSLNEVLAP